MNTFLICPVLLSSGEIDQSNSIAIRRVNTELIPTHHLMHVPHNIIATSDSDHFGFNHTAYKHGTEIEHVF